MKLELTAPFTFGPGAGIDAPRPVAITFSDGQEVTFSLYPFSRSITLALDEAGFDSDPFSDNLTPAEEYKRDKFLAEKLIAGWSPGIKRTDDSTWEYSGPEDAIRLAGHAGAMAMIKVAAMQLVIGMQEEREGNSESGSGTVTVEKPHDETKLNAVPTSSEEN